MLTPAACWEEGIIAVFVTMVKGRSIFISSNAWKKLPIIIMHCKNTDFGQQFLIEIVKFENNYSIFLSHWTTMFLFLSLLNLRSVFQHI